MREKQMKKGTTHGEKITVIMTWMASEKRIVIREKSNDTEEEMRKVSAGPLGCKGQGGLVENQHTDEW